MELHLTLEQHAGVNPSVIYSQPSVTAVPPHSQIQSTTDLIVV